MKSLLFFALLIAALNICSGVSGKEEDTELEHVQLSADIRESELIPLLENSRTARDAKKENEQTSGKGKKTKKQINKKKKTQKKKGKGRKSGKAKTTLKGKKKSVKGKKNSGKGKKKNGKGKNKSTKGKKKSGNGKKKSGNEKKKSGKADISEKQDACFTDMIAKTKKYRLYVNQVRKILNIERNINKSQNKKSKAGSAFEQAKAAMKDSTNSGKTCDGNSSSSTDAVEAYNTLANCSITAATLCDVSINSTASATATECKTSLNVYIKGFETCLTTAAPAAACTCFKALTVVDAKCEKFDPLQSEVLDKSKKCISGSEKGSFGDCRKSEQVAAYLGYQCKQTCAVATTQAPASGRSLLRRQLFANTKKKLI